MAGTNASVGEVYVDVLPDVGRFGRQLRTELASRNLPNAKVAVVPDVSGFRRELQARLSGLAPVRVAVNPDTSGFRRELQARLAGLRPVNVAVVPDASGFRRELNARLSGLRPVGVRVTPDMSGFRRELNTRLSALPPVAVNVRANLDASSVATLRAALTGVTGTRVKIDVDIDDALANIGTVQAALTALHAARVDIDVDNAAGLAHIAAVQAALTALRSPTTNVNVSTGNSASRVGLLVTLIAAIGPAAIPAGAAAVGALVAIGNAAIGVASGVGVAVLALSGIGGAVKALGQAQQARIKDQNNLVRQDRQLASGADQVRSAVASLANTRANADRSIANAERDVTRANKESLAAEQDLTRAREEAKQAAEDLNSQVANNALSIRQANLDLADAKKALDAVANLPVDNRARIDAQLAYDQAKQSLDDLTVRQGRLKTEKQATDRAGIEGSTQVLAAQQKIADSQERVRDAEAGLADARRQAAFSIAQAQQAITSAQRSAAASVQTATSEAETATDALREKLAALSPAGQGFARFVFGLKGDFIELRQAAETGFLPGLQRGIQSLLANEPDVVAFVAHIADGMGRITETQLKAFNAEPSRGFFRYLGDTAVPTLDQVVTSVGNVARGLGSVVVAFAPVNSQVGSGLVNLTDKWAKWAATLDHNQQFQHFLDYTLTRGPQVEQTIGRILGAGLHFLSAIAPVGDTVLLVIRGIATTIDAIPVPVITAAYAAFVAWRIATLIVDKLSTAVTGVSAALARVNVVSAGTNASVRTLTSSLAGPVTAALAVAALGVGVLLQRAADTKAKVDQLKQALDNYGSALKDGVNPASLENAKATLAQNVQLRGLITNLRDAGVSQKILVDGINGDRDARKQILAVLDAQIDRQRALAKEEAAAAGEDNPIVDPAFQKRINELENLRKAFSDTNAANAEANDLAAAGANTNQAAAAAAAKLTADWREMGISARGLNGEQGDLVRTMATLGDATSSATQKADAFRHAYDLLFGSVQKQSQATDDYNSKLLGLQESVESNGVSLDKHSRKGLSNRDAMREALRAIIDLDAADLANGATLDQVKGKHDQRIIDLENEAKKLGLSKQATADLVTQYGQIPSDVKTDFTSDGVQVVKDAFRDILTDVQYLLKYGYLPPRATGDNNHPSGGQKFAADGGYISGPGGPRDDLIPARLSNGEFVQQAAATAYYGVPFMAALNQRRIPRGVLPGFASGGFVQVPRQFPGVDPYKRPPVQDGPALAGALGFDFATIGTDVIRKQVIDATLAKIGAGGGGGLEEIKSFIRVADSRPYVFGAAGPEAWDCSGLAGAVYGLMLGLPNATSRRFFTTYDFAGKPPAGFKPGQGGIYSVGVNPQTHMAGVYGGLKFEAANSRVGIKVGPSARDVSTFQKQFHVQLAGGGLVDDELARQLGLAIGGDPSGITVNGIPLHSGTFDTGGVLPPGVTLAYNGTGGNEYINTAEQQRELVGAAAGAGGDTHYHLAGLGAEALGQLEAMRDREQILSRPGRPR